MGSSPAASDFAETDFPRSLDGSELSLLHALADVEDEGVESISSFSRPGLGLSGRGAMGTAGEGDLVFVLLTCKQHKSADL